MANASNWIVVRVSAISTKSIIRAVANAEIRARISSLVDRIIFVPKFVADTALVFVKMDYIEIREVDACDRSNVRIAIIRMKNRKNARHRSNVKNNARKETRVIVIIEIFVIGYIANRVAFANVVLFEVTTNVFLDNIANVVRISIIIIKIYAIKKLSYYQMT